MNTHAKTALAAAVIMAGAVVGGCVRPGGIDQSVVSRYQRLLVDVGPQKRQADADLGKDGIRAHPGPADSQISQNMDGTTYQKIFEDEGVRWVLSDKGPHSRAPGWERMRQYLKAAKDRTDDPWLVMFNTCPQLIRTLKALPRDEMKMDDVAKGAEDHLADALRYRLTTKRHSAGNAPVPWR